MQLVGKIPDSGSLKVTVHLDYPIKGSLTLEQIELFTSGDGFKYTFDIEIINGPFRVRNVRRAH